jgi:hypothetical protein
MEEGEGDGEAELDSPTTIGEGGRVSTVIPERVVVEIILQCPGCPFHGFGTVGGAFESPIVGQEGAEAKRYAVRL